MKLMLNVLSLYIVKAILNRVRIMYAAQRGGVPRRGFGGGRGWSEVSGRGFELSENPTPPRPAPASGFRGIPRYPVALTK